MMSKRFQIIPIQTIEASNWNPLKAIPSALKKNEEFDLFELVVDCLLIWKYSTKSSNILEIELKLDDSNRKLIQTL